MIKPSISIKGKLIAPIEIKGKTNASIIRPKLESLEVVPSTEDQNLTSELDGFSNVLVKGDENLKPENIKKGTTIFGIEGKSANTSDATASSSNLDSGFVAYTKNDVRIVGNARVLDENVIYSLPSQLPEVGVATVVRVGQYIPLIYDSYQYLKVDMGTTTLFPASRLPVDVVGKNILLRVNLRTAAHGYKNPDYVMHADLCIASAFDDVFEFRRDSSRDLIRCWNKDKKKTVNFQYYHFYKRLGDYNSTNYGTMEDITADKWEYKGKVSFGGDYYCYTNWHKFVSNTMYNSGGLTMATPSLGRGDDCFLKTVFKEDYDQYRGDYKLKPGGTLITRIPNEGVAKAIGLVPENIKKGYRYLGVEGNFEGIDTSDATVMVSDVLEGKTVYINNEKVEGTLPNNGELEYQPSEEEQSIPEGYTTGGTVKSVDITKMNEYEACLTLANSIDNLDDYSDTTATAEDIREGKIAYSNGERITGTMETKEDYNVAMNTQVSAGGNSSSSINRSITRIAGNLTVSGNSTQYMFNECWALETVPFIDLSNITNISYMFQECKSLKTIPEFDTSNVTDAMGVFSGCTNLEEIPQIDISKVTRSGMMFVNCTNLKTIPPLTIGASNMTNMFSGCPNLSDESLNNILLMCANSGVGNVTMKKLSYIGLTSTQASTCKTLSNYQAFLDAGWTTGY